MRLGGRLVVSNVNCRLYGHAWMPHDAWFEGRFTAAELICDRCYSKKHEKFVNKGPNAGSVESRRIKYAQGYLIKGTRITKAHKAKMRARTWEGKVHE